MTTKAKKVGFVVGSRFLEQCDRIPKICGRVEMTFSLIKSYGLMNKLHLIEAKKAIRSDLEAFHSSEYLDFCDKTATTDDIEKLDLIAKNDENFGLGYDCPLLPELNNLIGWIGGGSLSAADALVSKSCDLVINWAGGWHHSQRDEASGFCYVNDIVLAIQYMRRAFDKVLYIDLDVHHGDGVENAFAFTPKVFTLSIHKREPGYFPGTGSIKDVGRGKGKYYCLNFPLKDGIDDETYCYIFESLFDEINYAFRPNAIVVQCGADCLSLDPLGGFNLTPYGIGKCVQKVLRLDLPTLFLGGGGYNLANSSRFWTYLTSVILGEELSGDIPDSDEFFDRYGPSFELGITPGQRTNLNTSEMINDLLEEAYENLDGVS